MDADKLEAAVEAVAVVSEGRANPPTEGVADSPVLRPPVRTGVEKASYVSGSIKLGQNGLHRHCQLPIIHILLDWANLVESYGCPSEKWNVVCDAVRTRLEPDPELILCSLWPRIQHVEVIFS